MSNLKPSSLVKFYPKIENLGRYINKIEISQKFWWKIVKIPKFPRYDQRLAFQQIDPVVARRIKKLTVGVDYLGKLWKPDTFVSKIFVKIFYKPFRE